MTENIKKLDSDGNYTSDLTWNTPEEPKENGTSTEKTYIPYFTLNGTDKTLYVHFR